MRKDAWGIVSLVVALTSLAAPFVLFTWEREYKRVTVHTVSRSVVADLTDPALSPLRLTYADVPVSTVTIATLEIGNTGNQPIHASDFERPLRVAFTNGAPILAATASETHPGNLSPSVSHDGSSATIRPLLLNPGDRVRLAFVLRGEFVEPRVDARIAGVPDVIRVVLNGDQTFASRWPRWALGIWLAFLYFYMFLYFNPLRLRSAMFASIDGMVVAGSLALTSVFLVSDGLPPNWFLSPVAWFLVPTVPVSAFVIARRRRRAANPLFA